MKIARLSTCRQQHGALIVKGGRVVAVGVNHFRNHPKYVHSDYSTHAEIAALKACSDIDLSNATIYVARVTQGGRISMSKPCAECSKALAIKGIKKIVYTVDSVMDV